MPSASHQFYANLLLFVARRTEAGDERTRTLMAILERAAQSFAATGFYDVPATETDLTARALAGVAAFLQKQILPETVAAAHSDAEAQIRWAIDSAMDGVNTLLSRAGLGLAQDITLTLPDAPPPRPVTLH